jgi:hypothetical protein|tara:strand:- start:50 stop:391 length:342 start_codon:yes stop_codon:yes gene_type:complete
MQNEESNKMTFQRALPILVWFAAYAGIRYVFEDLLGYKNVPYLLCAFAILFLIEGIRSKNKQVICTVIAVEISIATFYVENVWLYWGLMASGILTIIVGMRGCKSCESVDSGD